MKKALIPILVATFFIAPIAAYATATSWDFASGILQPLQSQWSAVVKADHFQATSTTASIFPFASTTALSATTICLTSDCRTVWPSGGGSGTISTSSPLVSGQSVYATGVNTIASVATSTASLGSGLSYSGTLGNFISGVSGILANTGVLSFNTRTGTVTLTSGDVTSALGYTPSNFAYPFPSNATSTVLTFNGGLTAANSVTLSGITGSTQCLTVNSSGVVSGTGSPCGSGSGSVSSVSATYPIISSGGTTPNISTAFGTTTNNTYSGTNTFQNGVTTNTLSIGSLSGLLAGNTGTVYASATSTLTASSPLTGSFTHVGTTGSLGCQTASGSQAGCLSSTDWTTFNSKGSGTVTSVATNNGITGGIITTTGTIGLANIAANSVLANVTGLAGTPQGLATSSLFQNASTNTSGLLTSSDWNTFNGKQAAGNYITALTGDVTASGPGSVGATLATVNSNVGTFTYPSVTVNGKGLITAISNGTAPTTYSATWPITLSGSAFGFNGLSTSTPAVVGNIPYFSGVNTFANVATTSVACAGTASCSSFTIIGSSPVTITGTGITSAITSIGPAGQQQTGATQTLATTTSTTNGLVSALTIIGNTNTQTFTPSLSGILNVSGGGTGVSALASGHILYGSGSTAMTDLGPGTAGQVLGIVGGVPAWVATSTLSGTNYFTLTGNALQNNVGNSLGLNTAPSLSNFEIQASSTTASPLTIWNSSAAALFFVASTGQVSIGTTTSNDGGLNLIDTNSSGCMTSGHGSFDSLVFGGNPAGDTDFWNCRNSNNDSADNDSLQWGKGLVPGTTPYLSLLTGGNFGVATTSPIAKVAIAGNLWVTGDAGGPSYSVIGSDVPQVASNINPSSPVDGTDILVVATTSATANATRALASSVICNSTASVTCQGINSFAAWGAGATLNNAIVAGGGGVRNRYLANNFSTGFNVAQMSAVSADVLISGVRASSTDAADFHAESPTLASNTLVTDFYGMWVRGGSVSGTITNRYGINIDPLVGGTNRWGVFQNGSTDNNYFGGPSMFGTTTAPSAQLYVATTSSAASTLLFAVASSTSASLFNVLGNGNVGVGTSSPFANLSIVGTNNAVFAVATSTVSGSNKPVFEIDKTGHLITSGPAPVVSGGTSSVSGNDNNGTITVAGTLLTSVTLTFANAWATAPDCTMSDNSTGITADITSISTSQIVFGFSAGINSGIVWYRCEGHQ